VRRPSPRRRLLDRAGYSPKPQPAGGAWPWQARPNTHAALGLQGAQPAMALLAAGRGWLLTQTAASRGHAAQGSAVQKAPRPTSCLARPNGTSQGHLPTAVPPLVKGSGILKIPGLLVPWRLVGAAYFTVTDAPP